MVLNSWPLPAEGRDKGVRTANRIRHNTRARLNLDTIESQRHVGVKDNLFQAKGTAGAGRSAYPPLIIMS
jgi:hypothetical protein